MRYPGIWVMVTAWLGECEINNEDSSEFINPFIDEYITDK